MQTGRGESDVCTGTVLFEPLFRPVTVFSTSTCLLITFGDEIAIRVESGFRGPPGRSHCWFRA